METVTVELEQKWYTTAEVAERLGVTTRVIQRAILEHRLRAVKLSNRGGWRIAERDLQAWLASMANMPPDDGRDDAPQTPQPQTPPAGEDAGR